MKTMPDSGILDPQSDVSAAFTLLELIVVIALIAVLAGLLLPALSSARTNAASAACMGHLGQLQKAWLLYVDDHHGTLPPNGSRKVEFDQVSTPGSWVVGNAQIETNTANLETGVLFPYLRFAAVYRCPADKSTVLEAPHLRRNRSYSMSLWLSPDVVSGTAADLFSEDEKKLLGRFATIERRGTSRTWVFMDEHPVSLDDGVFIISGLPANSPTAGSGQWWVSFPGTQHRKGANLSFADGHVEHHRWRHHRTPAIYTGGPTPTVSDADLADQQWLRGGLPTEEVWK